MNLSLKLSILSAGWTQRQLSDATGIPETRLSDLARGRATPSLREREVLARALGKPAETLFQPPAIQAPTGVQT